MVWHCRKGVELVKCDIKSVFCLLSVHPDNFDLLGFSFEGNFYVDCTLPMGSSVLAQISSTLVLSDAEIYAQR